MDSLGNDLAGESLLEAIDLGTIAGGSTETVTGFLDSNSVIGGDFEDWYAFTLDEDSEVVVELSGLSNDATLQLLNSSGAALDINRTLGTADESLSMRLVAGTYVVDVGQFSGDSPIAPTAYTFDLTVTAIPDPVVAALYNEDGDRWNEGEALGAPVTISFSFMTALPSYHSESNFIAFNDDQKDAARAALDTWADVSNITFVETADSNDVIMRFGTVTTGGSSTSGFAFLPVDADANPNSVFLKAGDVFLSNDYGVHATNEDPVPGDAGFATLVHEIGHALGLKHPFEGNDQLSGEEDSDKFTVMSYSNHPHADEFDFTLTEGGATFASRPYHPETPMLFDIEAIQFIYGTNTTTRAGDTVYAVADEESLMRTIYDVGGNDTIDLSATTVDQRLDLTPGSFSDINFPDGDDIPEFLQAQFEARQELGIKNLAIDTHTVIENGIGGIGNDTITGNTADNSLAGGDGDDILTGGSGDDTLTGGAGSDTASGGGGNDTLVAGSGGGRLRGQAGNDVLVGGSGSDRLEGGDGHDVLDYSGAGGGVTVDLGTTVNQVIGADQGTDLIKEIEVLLGSAFADRLEGSGNADTLSGNAGADTILGRSGNDVIAGGDDLDLLRGHGGDDRLDGGIGNDNLKGGGQDDLMIGGDGADRLLGQSGNDTLDGGAGDDRIEGGLGLDLADYSSASGGVTVDLSVLVSQVIGADQGSDLIRDVEIVRGSGFADTLEGSNGDDTLLGEGGADKLLGRGGNDLIVGGVGDDVLRGHNGDDTLVGGTGSDNIKSGDGDDTLLGGSGNDILTGEAGNDVFVFEDGAGEDVINDFAAGSDRISLAAVAGITDFADLAANHMGDDGGNTTISFNGGNDVITINGINEAGLDAGDFIF